MRVVVTHLTGAFAGERQLIDEERLTIGRARDNRVRLGMNDTHASSHHAEIVADRDRYVLRDLGSKNGTFVNGKRVEQCRLVGGEAVAFGYGGPQLHFDFYERITAARPSLDEPHEFPFRARFAWSLFIASAALALAAVATAVEGLVLVAIPSGLAAAACLLLGLAAVRVNVTLGPDGVEHEGMFRTRRIAWTDVAALETVVRRTGTLSGGPACRVVGWKTTIQFSPADYQEGYLLARLIAETTAKEWSAPRDAGAVAPERGHRP
jgi:hypothetical protein